MVPWLTFRGLHTDHLEVVSADHRLAFRGLPAEGLRDCSREAASFPARHVGTAGVLGFLSSEGLSWAAPSVASPGDMVLGFLLASFPATTDRRKNTAAIAMARGFLGIFSAGRRTAGVHSSASSSLVAGSPFLGATLGGGPRLQGLQRVFSLPSGSRLRGSEPTSNFCGIPGVGTWILKFETNDKQFDTD